ncbi:MAG: hypothetical protein SGJ21_02960 [Alphaproteobacteria bacterium]|nr:hypothetical protein [Alphaproteobacteria bacterium]
MRPAEATTIGPMRPFGTLIISWFETSRAIMFKGGLSLSLSNKLLLVTGFLSLVAIALGAWVCALNGIASAVWVRNLAAWLVGAVAAYALGRWFGAWLFPVVLTAAALLLVSTLFSAGQLGVHRWVGAGPLSINVAMLMLPAALVAVVAIGRNTTWGWLPALACLAILVTQPDASQATAFGTALIWIALKSRGGNRIRRMVFGGTALLLAAGSWLRPDPLLPVPEVEEIVQLAYAISPALAVLALASLLLFSLVPGRLSKDGSPDVQLAGGALSVYFLICIAMPFIGAFPVPLLGVGISPVLGAWFGLGVLAALSRVRARSDRPLPHPACLATPHTELTSASRPHR